MRWLRCVSPADKASPRSSSVYEDAVRKADRPPGRTTGDAEEVTKVAERHQVLVVGGGFGGLSVTKALARADVDITIVDRTNHHLFQPLLYQVATGILSEGVIAPPLRGIIKKQANTRTVLAEVTRFDLDAKTVYGVSPDGRPLQRRYDTLVVAAGATHAHFGHDEWAAFAPGMKTLADARRRRRRTP